MQPAGVKSTIVASKMRWSGSIKKQKNGNIQESITDLEEEISTNEHQFSFSEASEALSDRKTPPPTPL